MNLIHLAPSARRASEILEAVARARGCMTPAEMAEFLSPLPTLTNPFREVVKDYPRSLERVAQAVASRETVVVYGDSDADGVCSLAIVVRLLRVAGANVRWFVPHRSSTSAGLTSAGMARCLATHKPTLIIAVDCGSNSRNEIESLSRRGVDTIVVDHHTLMLQSPGAIAHLNPLAHEPSHELTQLAASGLAYLWTEALAKDLGMERQWTRIREGSLIMAGLGTAADCVPLLGINRALIKHALHFAQQPIILERTPGLVALTELQKVSTITTSTFGREWAPRLNACGKMDDASVAIQLLLAPSLEEARPLAALCDESNNLRRREQEKVRAAALAQAEQVVQRNPDTRVILLHDHTWHPGVVSNVANNVRDVFSRPVIMLGWSESDTGSDVIGMWAGSGRGYDGMDFTTIINEAHEQGIVLSGGGHPNAVGVRLSHDRVEDFRRFLDERCRSLSLTLFQPSYEVLGNVDDLAPESWLKIFARLAPFGRGNPLPYLGARRAQLAHAPYPRRSRDDSARVFALSGLFRRENMPDDAGLLQFDWHDPEKAQHVWFPGRAYDVVLTLGRKPTSGLAQEAVYQWRVADCEPAA